MAYEFHYRRRIFWQDTDMAGIIHFTNYFRFMEEVELEFLFSLGLDSLKIAREYNVWRPRVAAQCDFKKTVTFGDELDVHLWVVRKGRSSIHYEIAFNHDGQEVAHGRLSVACVSRDAAGKMSATPIPPILDEALQVAPFAEVQE
ncbi:MAG: thioesterase family protein [Acidobacteria bacterium]|nr:thioesterase family protein [Acidobacteriota bacterium]